MPESDEIRTEKRRGLPDRRRSDPLVAMDRSAVDAHAARHHGLVTFAASGLSRSAWYRAIRAGHIEQLHPNVGRVAGSPPTHEQSIAAAVLAAGDGAMASHRSAAHLHGMPGRSRSDPVDVTVPDRRCPRLRGVLVHRPTDLDHLTPARVEGIRCTNVLRTLCDLGAVDPGCVVDAVGHTLTNRLASLSAMESILIAHGRNGCPGITALRAALDEFTIDAKPADSVLEQAMARLIARYRLPPVEFHPVIAGWEVDFRVASSCVVLECDGWAHHGLRRRARETTRLGADRAGFRHETCREARVTDEGQVGVGGWPAGQ